MRRFAFVCCLGLLWSVPAPAQSPTPEQKKSTLAWIQALQRDNGGFTNDSRPDSPASLAATTAALRALKYFGGQPAKPDACEKFVTGCYTKNMSGYAPTPGGKVDVPTTALGLMAAAELKLPPAQYVVQPVVFLCSNAKKFEDIRLAAAAYEGVQCKCELAADWIVSIQDKQNPDGTYGKGTTSARDTAGSVVTLLRLGGAVEKRDNVLKALKAGQLPDGGWCMAGNKSDLGSTYRVMRAFVMLKAQPQVEAARKFVAGCRNADGSYGVQPGQPGTVSATYYAGIILHWLDDMK
jgi:prenyltransferase beta subunit